MGGKKKPVSVETDVSDPRLKPGACSRSAAEERLQAMGLRNGLRERGQTQCFTVAFNITIAAGEALKEIARRRGVSMAAVVRGLIAAEIEQEGTCPKSES